MQKLRTKLDMAYIKAKNWISTKKEGSDKLMVMFIIITVAAGVWYFIQCIRSWLQCWKGINDVGR